MCFVINNISSDSNDAVSDVCPSPDIYRGTDERNTRYIVQ